MRLVAVALVALHLAGCASARAPRPPAGPVLRDGPVAVRAELLADAESQKRHFGRPLDPRLLARVVPIVLSIENVGARELLVVPADFVLAAPAGERVVPLHAVTLAEIFAETLGALEAGRPPRRERARDHPALELAMTIGTQVCLVTLFGCIVLVPPTVMGVALEASRAVGDRLRDAEGRATVRAVQDRDDALATVDGVAIPPRATVHGIVYFPAVPLESITGRPPFLVIRFTDRGSGGLAIVVRFDLAGPPPR